MNSPVITTTMIQAKARGAHARGAGRDDHGFNWHCSDAIATWRAEWDRCEEAFTVSLEQAAECPP